MAVLASRWFLWVGVALTTSGAVLFAAPASAVGARPHGATERSRPPPTEERPDAVAQSQPRIGREPGLPSTPQKAEDYEDRLARGTIVVGQVIGETPWHRDVALVLLGVGALSLGAHWVASRRTVRANQTA